MSDDSLGIKNIGPETEELLRSIGVTSKAQFEKLGAERAYLLILEEGHKPDPKLRLILMGAEKDVDWHILAEKDKRRRRSRTADQDEP